MIILFCENNRSKQLKEIAEAVNKNLLTQLNLEKGSILSAKRIGGYVFTEESFEGEKNKSAVSKIETLEKEIKKDYLAGGNEKTDGVRTEFLIQQLSCLKKFLMLQDSEELKAFWMGKIVFFPVWFVSIICMGYFVINFPSENTEVTAKGVWSMFTVYMIPLLLALLFSSKYKYSYELSDFVENIAVDNLNDFKLDGLRKKVILFFVVSSLLVLIFLFTYLFIYAKQDTLFGIFGVLLCIFIFFAAIAFLSHSAMKFANSELANEFGKEYEKVFDPEKGCFFQSSNPFDSNPNDSIEVTV